MDSTQVSQSFVFLPGALIGFHDGSLGVLIQQQFQPVHQKRTKNRDSLILSARSEFPELLAIVLFLARCL